MTDDKPEKPGLSRPQENERMMADLDRALADKFLAQSDVGDALARDFEASATLMLPTVSEIDQRLSQAGSPARQSAEDIEKLLSLESVGDIAIEGMKLNELLDRGGASAQERSILKRGLLFLRKRMYSEATEWWLLNRPKEALGDPRFYCLCTLLLAFTNQLAGQTAQAEAAAQEAIRVRKMM